MDGFAVRAEDTFGATEAEPVELELLADTAHVGSAPAAEVWRNRTWA